MAKKTISQENDDLKFWITYIQYRAKHHWAGKPGEYCTTDIENIVVRLKEDIFNTSKTY
tara:strand:- start:3127 stop:3303 length:177 start_codon:yes stop_codon:yes gene_type:complete